MQTLVRAEEHKLTQSGKQKPNSCHLRVCFEYRASCVKLELRLDFTPVNEEFIQPLIFWLPSHLTKPINKTSPTGLVPPPPSSSPPHHSGIWNCRVTNLLNTRLAEDWKWVTCNLLGNCSHAAAFVTEATQKKGPKRIFLWVQVHMPPLPSSRPLLLPWVTNSQQLSQRFNCASRLCISALSLFEKKRREKKGFFPEFLNHCNRSKKLTSSSRTHGKSNQAKQSS